MPPEIRATLAIALLASGLSPGSILAAEPEPAHGQELFGRACAACHSLSAGRNMTGPTLRGLWNRHAGSVPSFARYSPALKSSAVVWSDETLNRWLANPQAFVPGNEMTFRGLPDGRDRADLIAFLKSKST